jgi:UDP-N-acetylmuramoylalanine--D-glutamate ligase
VNTGAPGRALVIGYGLSGRAATSWLGGHGWDVTVIDDNPAVNDDPAVPEHPAAGPTGLTPGAPTIELAPSPGRAAELARRADLVVPSPGVPVGHPALAAAAAAGVDVRSEIELAWAELADQRARRDPGATDHLVAITGTNGKTTVTGLVAAMLMSSGVKAVAAGNVGYPLLQAVAGLSPEGGTVVVAEVSSFQLHYTRHFRPDTSCWLNFAPDHLDWHPTLDHYARAKGRIWANQLPGSTVVVNADDPTVMAAAADVPAGVELVTFGRADRADRADRGGRATRASQPTWRTATEAVLGPDGFVLKAVELPRSLPHDLANTAAALAVALGAGATPEGSIEAARHTPAPAHRVQWVGEAGGVAWYDDSKATTPASVHAAVQGFRSVVLIAGGRNKGLDLSVLADTAPPVSAVVAIGESSADVASAFAGRVPVRTATSMSEAVEMAAGVARPGDAVLLSPGCASFDWYKSYAERGEHFASLVQATLREVVQPCQP